MVRLAKAGDEKELKRLSAAFNGEGETTLEAIRDCIRYNRQEVVVVDEKNGVLVGFVCVQLKKSFCYEGCSAELTEVYVAPEYRRRGIAGATIAFAEAYCAQTHSITSFSLLTGADNQMAQSVYKRLGYRTDGEIHLSQKIHGPVLPAD